MLLFLHTINLHITILSPKTRLKVQCQILLINVLEVTYSLIVTIAILLLSLFGYVLKFFADLSLIYVCN